MKGDVIYKTRIRYDNSRFLKRVNSYLLFIFLEICINKTVNCKHCELFMIKKEISKSHFYINMPIGTFRCFSKTNSCSFIQDSYFQILYAEMIGVEVSEILEYCHLFLKPLNISVNLTKNKIYQSKIIFVSLFTKSYFSIYKQNKHQF